MRVLGREGITFLTFAPNPDPAQPTANGTYALPRRADFDPSHPARPSKASVIHSDLARWLLEKETGVAADPTAAPAAAEHVCQKLSRHLARLVSPAGSQAILSRALHLAQAEFPFLEGVRAGRSPEVCFEGLDEHVHDVDPSEVGQGLRAVLGTMLDLLVGFIGEDLTMRLLREVWPDLAYREPSRPGSPDGQEANS
jgi:hypothetical protein